MINRRFALVHEWMGLDARVKRSSCKEMEGARGAIVDETKNTLVLEDRAGREVRIPKKSAVFELRIGGEWLSVKGKEVCYAPEDRLKKLFRKV